MEKKSFIIIFLLIFSLVFSYTSRDFFENGKTAYQAGKYSLAIDLFKKTLASDREKKYEESTLYYLSLALHYNGDYKDSINYLLNLLNKYPETIYKEQATFFIAINYYKTKDYETALNRLRKYIASFPKGKWVKDAKFTIAYILMFMNQYTQASKEWENFIREFPKDEKTAESNLRLGQSYFYDENYKKAKTVFLEFVDNFKNSPFYEEGLFFLGKTYYFLDENEKATQIFESLKNKSSFPYYEDVLYFGGSSFVRINRFREALDMWLNLTNSKEYSYDINYKIGVLYRDLKEYENSIFFLKKALSIADDKNKRKVNYEIGLTLYEQGNYDEALNIFESLNRIEDEITPLSLQKSGEIYYEKKSYKIAYDKLSIVINRYSVSKVYKDALYYRAKVNYELGNYDATIKDVELYLLRDDVLPDERASSYILTGDSYIAMGKFEEAANSYLKLLTLKSSYPEEKAYQLAGWAYTKGNNYEKAKSYYDKILKTSKDRTYLALANYNIGILEYNRKNYTESRKIFENVYKNYKDTEYSEEAALKIGWIYFKEEKFKQLVDYLNNITISKKWDYFNLKGWGYFRLGEYKIAIDNFTNSISYALDSLSSNDSIRAVGKSYYNLNDYKNAFFYFEKAYYFSYETGLTNELPSLISDMAWSLVKSGDFSKAYQYYEELIEKYPNSPATSESLFKLAEYYFNISDFKRALNYYQKIIDLNYDANFVSLSYYWAGWCYLNMNDKKRAMEYFEKYVNLFPKGEYTPDVLLRIATIYYEWNNLSMSIETLEKLIKNYPSSYETEKAKPMLSEIKIKYQSQGNEEEYYKLSIKEAKTKDAKVQIMLKLANYYKERNQKEESIKVYKEIIGLTTKEEAAIATTELAFYDIEDGKYTEAIDKLTSIFQVYKVTSLYPKALYGIAFSNYKLGKLETAKRYVQRLKDNYPSSEWTAKASEILK
ncbi:MAG: tetratricopeptide repeat protein [Brevinematales bacterium]|nr:tetratricopeptide repeat protein [Brevinematales bacterium]